MVIYIVKSCRKEIPEHTASYKNKNKEK
jgi:hypothetical protein